MNMVQNQKRQPWNCFKLCSALIPKNITCSLSQQWMSTGIREIIIHSSTRSCGTTVCKMNSSSVRWKGFAKNLKYRGILYIKIDTASSRLIYPALTLIWNGKGRMGFTSHLVEQYLGGIQATAVSSLSHTPIGGRSSGLLAVKKIPRYPTRVPQFGIFFKCCYF